VSADEIGLWAGFVLTLMVFSYVLGDNFLYRLAVYIFVGLAAGFIAIVTLESVLIPWVDSTIGSGDAGSAVVGAIPFILGALLLFKTSTRLARLGNVGIAFVIGVGAAVAIAGAITGTLIPLTRTTTEASANAARGASAAEAGIILIGVATSLLYFQYMARRRPDGSIQRGQITRGLALIGEGFIVVTLGAVYGAAILTSLTIFSERVAFLLTQIGG
jgi:hypothetical protein